MPSRNLKRLYKPLNYIFFLGLLFTSSASFAFYCSGNGYNGFINIGDSEVKVAQTCGEPTLKREVKQQQTTINAVQYWTYSNERLQRNYHTATGSEHTSIVKTGPMIVVQMINGEVSQMTVSGRTEKSARCPSGQSITLGEKSSDVLLRCGEPSHITTTHTNNTNNNQSKITQWTYDYGSYRNPLLLEFTDGQLSKVTE